MATKKQMQKSKKAATPKKSAKGKSAKPQAAKKAAAKATHKSARKMTAGVHGKKIDKLIATGVKEAVKVVRGKKKLSAAAKTVVAEAARTLSDQE
jgi:hypothetical protein